MCSSPERKSCARAPAPSDLPGRGAADLPGRSGGRPGAMGKAKRWATPLLDSFLNLFFNFFGI